MNPGDIVAGVVLASVPLWSLRLGVLLALVFVSVALLVGLWAVFGRRGGS